MKDYQTLIYIVIAVIIFVVIVTIFIKAKKKNQKKSESETSAKIETSSEIDLDLKEDNVQEQQNTSEEKKSKIYFSPELNDEKVFYEQESNHVVKKILVYHEKETVWVCPYCETENPLSNSSCFLCNHGHE